MRKNLKKATPSDFISHDKKNEILNKLGLSKQATKKQSHEKQDLEKFEKNLKTKHPKVGKEEIKENQPSFSSVELKDYPFESQNKGQSGNKKDYPWGCSAATAKGVVKHFLDEMPPKETTHKRGEKPSVTIDYPSIRRAVEPGKNLEDFMNVVNQHRKSKGKSDFDIAKNQGTSVKKILNALHIGATELPSKDIQNKALQEKGEQIAPVGAEYVGGYNYLQPSMIAESLKGSEGHNKISKKEDKGNPVLYNASMNKNPNSKRKATNNHIMTISGIKRAEKSLSPDSRRQYEETWKEPIGEHVITLHNPFSNQPEQHRYPNTIKSTGKLFRPDDFKSAYYPREDDSISEEEN